MMLVRYILIGLIVYLLVRSFARHASSGGSSSVQNGTDKDNRPGNKKISKKIGEYIDYEELKK